MERGALYALDLGVSNALRPGAYPAGGKVSETVNGKRVSPMPFGWVPIRQLMAYDAAMPESEASPMPFGWVPIRQGERPMVRTYWPKAPPMPFG